MINRLLEESTPTAAASSNAASRPTRPLALPFVGLAIGALPGAAYGALVAFVHLAVSGRWDQAPALAAGATRCAAVTAAIGLVVGIWLAISRVRKFLRDGDRRAADVPGIEEDGYSSGRGGRGLTGGQPASVLRALETRWIGCYPASRRPANGWRPRSSPSQPMNELIRRASSNNR